MIYIYFVDFVKTFRYDVINNENGGIQDGIQDGIYKVLCSTMRFKVSSNPARNKLLHVSLNYTLKLVFLGRQRHVQYVSD